MYTPPFLWYIVICGYKCTYICSFYTIHDKCNKLTTTSTNFIYADFMAHELQAHVSLSNIYSTWEYGTKWTSILEEKNITPESRPSTQNLQKPTTCLEYVMRTAVGSCLWEFYAQSVLPWNKKQIVLLIKWSVTMSALLYKGCQTIFVI